MKNKVKMKVKNENQKMQATRPAFFIVMCINALQIFPIP